MLGKLLKYDFRSMWKQFAIIWPAVLVVALVNRFTFSFNLDNYERASGAVVAVITMTAFAFITIAMFVVAMIFIIQRFYKGLLGREGYLMHTLPVRPWQLIASKLICAMTAMFLSMLVVAASLLLIFPEGWLNLLNWSVWREIWQAFWSSADPILYLVEVLLLTLIDAADSILMIYFCMALGHLFTRHRVLASVAAFLIIPFVLDLLSLLLPFQTDSILPIIFGIDGGFSFGGNISLHAWLRFSLATTALQAVFYFFGTQYILKRKLNLE
jgi:hypothetical protein